MASTKNVTRTPSGKIKYRGEVFSGYNKPKRTPGKNKKSAVLAKKGDQIKLVRFGDPNMKIKKHSLLDEKVLELGTNAKRLKINSVPDTGRVRLGEVWAVTVYIVKYT